MSARIGFIKTSIMEVLQEGIAAVDCMQDGGLETFPMLEYTLQSIFLKMTGYGEQKLRFIIWEIASYDLEFRYNLLKGECSFGEFSKLSDKKNVYVKLCKEISIFIKTDILTDDVKNHILQEIRGEMNLIFENSALKNAFPNEYERFFAFFSTWNADSFAKGNELLRDNLVPIYSEYVYKMRNRCAHNTLSYQQDYLGFEDMQKPYMVYANYFTCFALLLLLDKIFVYLFKSFERQVELNV